MKKFINSPQNVATEFTEGMVGLDSRIGYLEGSTTVIRVDSEAPRAANRVAVLSGGGAGHEPAHAGFVGRGMLSAAVSGEVFASPSVDSVLDGIRAVSGPRGALLIVKNYTGDRLNFGLAAELAKAEGIPVRVVVVGDDAALASATGSGAVGRRGLAGTVFVHKVAGASAESGAGLDEVAELAEAAAKSISTMAVALSGCTPPASGKAGFTLGDDELEFGLGIHGEQGLRRAPMDTADNITESLLETVLKDGKFTAGTRVALLVNGLGGTPLIELGIVARKALEVLRHKGLVVERALCGSYLTALEMAGVSISLMPLDDRRLALLDAPASTFAWNGALLTPPAQTRALPSPVKQSPSSPAVSTAQISRQLVHAIDRVTQSLLAAEDFLTELDRQVGDGDLGTSLSRGSHAIREEMKQLHVASEAGVVRAMAAVVRRAVGGTSGPLYAIGLLRAAEQLDRSPADRRRWADALMCAANGVSELGGASEGERTMLDALIPAAKAQLMALDVGADPKVALHAAVLAARNGVSATAAMRPRRGRSSYIGQRAIGIVDPGAEAVAIWLEALEASLGDTPDQQI